MFLIPGTYTSPAMRIPIRSYSNAPTTHEAVTRMVGNIILYPFLTHLIVAHDTNGAILAIEAAAVAATEVVVDVSGHPRGTGDPKMVLYGREKTEEDREDRRKKYARVNYGALPNFLVAVAAAIGTRARYTAAVDRTVLIGETTTTGP